MSVGSTGAPQRAEVPALPAAGAGVSEPEPAFEQAQAELEQIVERLERGNAPLDEALASGNGARSSTRSAGRNSTQLRERSRS